MDLRLDFFNELNKYSEQLTEDDALLVLSHNKKEGDCITLLAGDWEILSMLFSIDGYVNFEKGNKTQFENIKKMIMNTAYNICITSEDAKDKFLTALLPPNEKETCECKDCNHQWNPYETEHFNFTCCELCGSDNIGGDYYS